MRFSHVLTFVAGTALLGACGGDSNGPSNAVPIAGFTAPSCTVNVACSFSGTGTDSDGSITGYSWNFGDQSAASTDQNATHTFTTANTYQVTLTVTDNGGAGDRTKPVTVSAAPPSLAADFTVTCNGLDCTFTDASTPAAPSRTNGTSASLLREPTTRPPIRIRRTPTAPLSSPTSR